MKMSLLEQLLSQQPAQLTPENPIVTPPIVIETFDPIELWG
jgi:hypothetical protein